MKQIEKSNVRFRTSLSGTGLSPAGRIEYNLQ